MDVEDDLDAFLKKEDILGYYMEVNDLLKRLILGGWTNFDRGELRHKKFGKNFEKFHSNAVIVILPSIWSFIFLAFDRW